MNKLAEVSAVDDRRGTGAAEDKEDERVMAKVNTGLWLLATSALATVIPLAAQAQTSGSPTVPAQVPADASAPESSASSPSENSADIVVTAQRRSERVQDVPIAISVVSGAQLERQQIVELRDLSRSTAGLEFGANSGANPGGGASIRGLGTTAFSRAAEAAVGVVVDGVVQGNANVNNLFDVARVEVLRGPQGTLFGQSTSAGVINISTVAPSFERAEGRFLVELSDDGFAGSKFGRQVLRAAANAPITERSALRVSLYSGRTAGVTRNVLLNRDDEQYEFGVRARYLAELGDRVTLNLIGDYSDSKNDDGNFFVFGGAAPGTNAARFNAQCGVAPSLTNFEHCSDYPVQFRTKTYGLSGQVDVDVGGGFTLTSITAARRQRFFQSNDIDRLPEAVTTLNISALSTTSVRQFTQEVRLASDTTKPLSFTVGGYYQNAKTIEDVPGIAGNNIYFARAGIPGPPVLQTRTVQNTVNDLENLSGFGEARLRLGEFTVFGGARVNRNTQDAVLRQRTLAPVVTPFSTLSLGLKDTDVSWRVGGQYEPNANIMVYGTVSRGYKSGQVAANVVPPTVVQPEKPMDYQLGVKTQMFDRRLAINLAGFYTRVSDYQATVTTVNPDTGVVQGLPFNIDRVISKGVELEMFGRIGDHLTLNGSALYNIAKYPGGFRAINGSLLEGQQIAFAPRFKATLSGEYAQPLSEHVDGVLAVDGAYKGRTRYGVESGDSVYNFYQAHLIVGARVGVRIDETWDISLFARNIGNVASPFSIGLIPQPLGDPALSSRHVYQGPNGLRQVGLQVGLKL